MAQESLSQYAGSTSEPHGSITRIATLPQSVPRAGDRLLCHQQFADAPKDADTGVGATACSPARASRTPTAIQPESPPSGLALSDARSHRRRSRSPLPTTYPVAPRNSAYSLRDAQCSRLPSRRADAYPSTQQVCANRLACFRPSLDFASFGSPRGSPGDECVSPKDSRAFQAQIHRPEVL